MNVFGSNSKNKEDKKEDNKGLKNIFNFKKKDKKDKKPAGTNEKSKLGFEWKLSRHRTGFLISVGLAAIGIALYFFGLYSQQLQKNKDPKAQSLILEWYRFAISATWLSFHAAACFYDFDKLPIPRISLLGLTIIALSFVPLQIHNNLFLKSQLKEPSPQDSMALLFSISGQVLFCLCLIVAALLVGIDEKEFKTVRFKSTTV